MSIEYRDYPDITGQCALCKKHDCSKSGEKWVHLLTIEDQLSIGRKCLQVMFDNADFTHKVETRETVRPPTDEEVGIHVRKLVEALHDGHSTGSQSGGKPHDTHHNGQNSDTPQKRTRRSKRAHTSRNTD